MIQLFKPVNNHELIANIWVMDFVTDKQYGEVRRWHELHCKKNQSAWGRGAVLRYIIHSKPISYN